MSEEVKRYDYTIVADQGGYTYIDRIEKHDGSVVEYEDWESERQARLEAETKLRELQDAENILSIYSFDGIAGIHTDEESDMHDEALKLHEAAVKESRDRAIQESRIRRQTT